MSDTPKFTVVDRRKFRGDEESSTEATPSAPVAKAAESAAPRLTLVEPSQHSAAKPEQVQQAVAVAEAIEEQGIDGNPDQAGFAQGTVEGFEDESQLPPAPTREESLFQKAAYDKAAERLDTLVRAQNPGAPPQETIGFEHLVQQLYLSAMMQMGAGTPEGQRPRIDILGARQTIDLLQVVLDKTEGNRTADQSRAIDTVLFELRLTFLELTRMISAQPPMPPPPGAGNPGARR